MRERSLVLDTNTSASDEAAQEINGTLTGVTMTTPSVVTSERISTIRDFEKGRGWKTCEHTKVWNFVQPGHDDTYYLRSNPGNVVRWIGRNSYWSNWDISPPLFAGGFQAEFPVSEMSQLSETLDRFYSDENINNILNLVEAPELPKSLADLKKSVDDWVVGYRSQATAKVQATRHVLMRARQYTSLASKGLLTYSFGIAPLLADMKKTAEVCFDYRNKLKRYLNSAGKVEIVRTSVAGTLTHPHAENASIPSAGYLIYKGTTIKHPTRVIAVRGLRKSAYKSTVFQHLDFIATRLLGRGPFNFAWERIPFSFVVDWFADLRTFTGAVDSLIVGKQQQITGQLSTVQWSAMGSAVHSDTSGAYHDTTYDGASMSGSRVDYYHRKVLGFNPLWVGSSGRFGKKQLALSGALLFESILKAKRK